LRVLEFNLHVARYAHRSWYGNGGLGEAVSRALFDSHGRFSDLEEPYVSRWLLHELGLWDETDWDMDEPQKRIWLLDGPSLARLARELALAMHREWLVQVIDSVGLRALQGKVGAQSLHFVVTEVPEGAFHYQLPTLSFDADSSIDVSSKLTEHGVRTLMALLHPAWRAVRGRAPLYFERAWALEAVPAFEPAQVQRALELICGHLIPQRFPEWAWCF
jgi:hypothetical protein